MENSRSGTFLSQFEGNTRRVQSLQPAQCPGLYNKDDVSGFKCCTETERHTDIKLTPQQDHLKNCCNMQEQRTHTKYGLFRTHIYIYIYKRAREEGQFKHNGESTLIAFCCVISNFNIDGSPSTQL